MNNVWFVSDTHFSHAAILKHGDRPFASIEEMDSHMIALWNNVVGKQDLVYHLGDFAFRNFEQTIRQLNGQIHLIYGNHDKELRRGKYEKLFASRSDMKEIKVQDEDRPEGFQRIVLCHYALRVWNRSHHGAWHLYGHSHGSLPDLNESMSMDVGVDATGVMCPVSYDWVKHRMSKKTYAPVDYHTPSMRDEGSPAQELVDFFKATMS